MNKPQRVEVPVGKIDLTDIRFRFRKNPKIEAIMNKKDSINELGLLNPIKLWKQGDKYTIIAGWQRTIIVISIDKPTITADVWEDITYHDALMINIADNNLREDLSEYEVARQMQALRDKDNYSVEEIASLFHCGEDRVYDMLSVFKMDEALRTAFEEGKLSLYKAVVISRYPFSERSEILKITLEEGRSISWLRDELSRRHPRPLLVASPKRDDSSFPLVISDVRDPKRSVSVSGIRSGDSTSYDVVHESVTSKAYDPPLFCTSEVYDMLLKWYPEEALDELWDRLPDDDARKVFFPKLFSELWRVAWKKKRTEVLITRLLKGEHARTWVK